MSGCRVFLSDAAWAAACWIRAWRSGLGSHGCSGAGGGGSAARVELCFASSAAMVEIRAGLIAALRWAFAQGILEVYDSDG